MGILIKKLFRPHKNLYSTPQPPCGMVERVDISVDLCGLKLKNPTMLASGLVGISGAACLFAAQHEAGAIVPKSIGPREREGHKNPILVEFQGGFLNAVGLPNAGVDQSLGELEFAMKNCEALGVPVILSLFGGTKEEYGEVARKLSSLNPPMLEVNLSCPNTAHDFGRAFSLNAQDAADVIRIVKQNTNTLTKVSAKLAPNVPDIKEIAKAVVSAGADAITATNTMPGMIIDVATGKPVLQNKEGGISGYAMKPIAVRCIYDLYKTVNVPIIGSGGVTTGNDALEMIMAGATAVQIGTGIYYRGIDVFRKVTEEIVAFMKKEGYNNLSEIRGLAHKD